MSIVTEYTFSHLAEQRERELQVAAERRRVALERMSKDGADAPRSGLRARLASALHLHSTEQGRQRPQHRSHHAPARG